MMQDGGTGRAPIDLFSETLHVNKPLAPELKGKGSALIGELLILCTLCSLIKRLKG
jgi:hypothetical protein